MFSALGAASRLATGEPKRKRMIFSWSKLHRNGDKQPICLETQFQQQLFAVLNVQSYLYIPHVDINCQPCFTLSNMSYLWNILLYKQNNVSLYMGRYFHVHLTSKGVLCYTVIIPSIKKLNQCLSGSRIGRQPLPL